MIGQGAIAQLEEVLAPLRVKGGPAVWFFDHFFTHNDLPKRLPVAEGDVVVFVDTSEEPTTDGIDAYTGQVKKELAGATPCVLLAFGGGATMDTCKCVGNLLTNPGRAEDYQGWELVKNPDPRIVAAYEGTDKKILPWQPADAPDYLDNYQKFYEELA